MDLPVQVRPPAPSPKRAVEKEKEFGRGNDIVDGKTVAPIMYAIASFSHLL